MRSRPSLTRAARSPRAFSDRVPLRFSQPHENPATAGFSTPHYVAWYGKGKRRQNWTTPRSLFDPLHAEYQFTLDGASEPGNALLPKASSALAPVSWVGERVFCNPPWSNIRAFVELAGTADLAVLLVPARTNTRWFHRALELGATPRFFLGRIAFGNAPEGTKGHNSPVDCLLLVFQQHQTIFQ